jgi:hypothetical protein
MIIKYESEPLWLRNFDLDLHFISLKKPKILTLGTAEDGLRHPYAAQADIHLIGWRSNVRLDRRSNVQ